MSYDALLELARNVQRNGRPAIQDPLVRQQLAEAAGYVATQEWAVARMLTAIHKDQDAKVMGEMLMAKLLSTDTQQRLAKLALDLLPAEGLREPSGEDVVIGIKPFTQGRWVSHYVHARWPARSRAAPRTSSATSSANACSPARDQRPAELRLRAAAAR
jgi:alkylation response protein AidB-like acyl-CoA dehydrogenase